jgi:DNA polymerase
MKRSEYAKTIRLAKRYLEDQKFLGEDEMVIEKTPAARKRTVAVAKKLPAHPVAHANMAVTEPEKTYTAPAPVAGKEMTRKEKERALEALKNENNACKKCALGKTRRNYVFGVGNPDAKLMFVGEAPGLEEDRQGEPFVGRAGQLLNKIIESIGFKREDVYIANIAKCHPMIDPSDPEKRGNDRPPTAEEMAACIPVLDRQIEIIHPTIICALGNTAVHGLLKTETGITKLRGKFTEYRGIKVMPTYHPAALLRNPALKKDTWEDMKMIRDALKEQK